MQFINGTVETFCNVFGNHGLQYVFNVERRYPGKTLHIVFAKKGDFPEIDNAPVQAFVSHLDLETLKVSYNKEDPLSVVIYPENMKGQYKDHEGICEEFMNIGTLIHEMTHVKQVWDGRMESIAFMEMRWEGEYHKIEIQGYLTQPWEKEACMAQLQWITKGDVALAMATYDAMVRESYGIKL